tara:strand:+ start:189 stop:452 length:264 start_codon:yes stop_codon:yes gene_type:complete
MINNQTNKFNQLISSGSYPYFLFVITIAFSSIAVNLIPIAQSARLKNNCIVSAKKSLKFKNPDPQKFGLTIEELASIEGFRFCMKGN